MTTRRKFLRMLGLAPVAAAVTTAIVKDALAANPGTSAIQEETLPFKIKDNEVSISDSYTVMDENGMKGYRNGKLIFQIGKLE